MKKTRFCEFSLDELNLMATHLPIVERTDGTSLRHELQVEIDRQTVRSIVLDKYELFADYELKTLYKCLSLELGTQVIVDNDTHLQLIKEIKHILTKRQKPSDL